MPYRVCVCVCVIRWFLLKVRTLRQTLECCCCLSVASYRLVTFIFIWLWYVVVGGSSLVVVCNGHWQVPGMTCTQLCHDVTWRHEHVTRRDMRLTLAVSSHSMFTLVVIHWLPSVLWRCWLGGRKRIQPVKTEWWGAGVVICLERGANDLHMIQLMPLPPRSSSLAPVKSRMVYLSGAGLPRLSWKKAVKRL